MNSALQSSLTSNPGLKGVLYLDSNGLCISGEHSCVFYFIFSAVGELNAKDAGRYSSISRLAGALEPNSPPPVILIETRERHILVKECDTNTVVLKCLPNSD